MRVILQTSVNANFIFGIDSYMKITNLVIKYKLTLRWQMSVLSYRKFTIIIICDAVNTTMKLFAYFVFFYYGKCKKLNKNY